MRTRLTYRIGLLIAIGTVLLALAAILRSQYAPLFPPAPATLLVQRGSVQVKYPDNRTLQATPNINGEPVGQGVVLNVSTDGRATLRFSDDTSIDLFPGSQVTILDVRRADTSVQVRLRLDGGQIIGQVGVQPDHRAQFEVALPFGGYLTARQADFIAVIGHKTFVGALRGEPILALVDGELPIPTSSGLTIASGEAVDKAHLTPRVWAWVRVPLYKPDGSATTLPITLTRDDLPEVADNFEGESGSSLLVPDGPYKLSVALEAQPAYTLMSLTLPAGQLTEWPVTLGEIQFSFVDSVGKSLPTPALLIGTGKQTVLPPDSPILVGPTTGFTLARADSPDQTQYTGDLAVAPGQRLSLPIRADMFGAGGLQATILDVNNIPLSAAANVSIKVYKPGTEDTSVSPIGILRSDSAVALFPPADYVIVVSPLRGSPIAMSARYSVTVTAAQTTSLIVKLGTLNVNYLDSNGNPLTPQLIYLAVASVLKTLNQPIEQLHETMPLYGYNLSPGQTSITVPAGDYAIQVEDRRAPPLRIVSVAPGKNPAIVITAIAPTVTSVPTGTPMGVSTVSD